MKIKLLTMLVLVLLSAVFVSAVDIRPTVDFYADSYHVVTEAMLHVTAYDKLDNAGLLWIRIYENNALISEHNCYSLTICKHDLKVVHPEGGSFKYLVLAKDIGDKQSDKTYLPSDSSSIIFDGNLPPQISNPQPSPFPTISAGETINFRVTATDPEGKNLNVVWKVDQTQVGPLTIISSGSIATFSYDKFNPFSFPFKPPATATYLVQAEVSDEWPAFTSTYSWTVNVIQTDLTGIIFDSNNKIYRAKVELLNGSSSKPIIYTIENGLYEFLNIIKGTYNLGITKAGFTDQLIQLTISLGSNTRNVVLVPATFSGTITGKVLNGSDGTTPIPNAEVIIISPLEIIPTNPLGIVQTAYSDTAGNYRINGLPPTVGFNYDIDVDLTIPIPPYTQSFGPSGINLNSGQTLTNQNIYLLPP